MSNRKLVKAVKILHKRISRLFVSLRKIGSNIWGVLRTLLLMGRPRPGTSTAGFVLPTVVMVTLVVILLTTAILFRSFERSQNASNVRVNQAVLKAATPAIDRARAKIEQLFNDPTLPRTTPSDTALYDAIRLNIAKYTFGDETPLQIQYDINGDNAITPMGAPLGGINANLENSETAITGWRVPTDTDNNGKFDSFTLYSIYFRSPSRNNTGAFNRPRSPLDARTPPQDDGTIGGICSGAAGTSASLVGESGWYRSGANLKKSFYVYTVNVPITNPTTATSLGTNYETYQGTRGFSALEFQQDQARKPIVNNAVVYEDDLEITPGAGLRLNGSVFTNSNLLIAQTSAPIRLYLVSSPPSCFYKEENNKITVGGNVGNGRITGAGEGGAVRVDLFNPAATNGSGIAGENINGTNRSAAVPAGQMAYNTKAYADRIQFLIDAHRGTDPTQFANYANDPKEVRDAIDKRINANPGLNNDIDKARIRRELLETYFKNRTRRVPFQEVALGGDATTGGSVQGNGDTLRPVDTWVNIANTGINLTAAQLNATQPETQQKRDKGKETRLGDRILVGNNLPALRLQGQSFVTPTEPVDGTTQWQDVTDPANSLRTRTSRIQRLITLDGVTERDGYFEEKAATPPVNVLDNQGGMRVVTGAGIYVDDDGTGISGGAFFPRGTISALNLTTTLPQPGWDPNFVDPTNADTNPNTVPLTSLAFNAQPAIPVWSDAMPMGNPASPSITPPDPQLRSRGDLLMRATAVYHYTQNTDPANFAQQQPIACISSYYDPTNPDTAQNQQGLPWQNPALVTGNPTLGKSNNGIVYNTVARATALSTYLPQLQRQARLVYPDGRFVNEPLRKALTKVAANQILSLADNSAIDTAACALGILNSTLTPQTPTPSSPIQNGTIYETAFLDARQVKSIETTNNVASIGGIPNYTRSVEERQPLEVRTTVLDLNQLRTTQISGGLAQEYLIPNSGIIYATRDDALPDLSNPNGGINISSTDYKLDSTRRPNGIMLINGKNLARNQNYANQGAEKGLILASNVPTYIQGTFNLHDKGGNTATTTNTVEEFAQTLNADWNNFYGRGNFTPNRGLDDNFACRPGDPRLPTGNCQNGDSWRPATVIADAVTILSNNFRAGFRNEGDFSARNNAGNAVVPNYDFNGNGNATDTINETTVGFDVNGDGDATDTAVSEANQVSLVAVRRLQGFYDNNYLTSSAWFDNTIPNPLPFPKDFDNNQAGIQGSSYVNNFVTPIQRRVKFNEYLMEICRQPTIAQCTPNDWGVIVDANSNGNYEPAGDNLVQASTVTGIQETRIFSGTTARLADPQLQRFPRRVAFDRNPNNTLRLDSKNHPIPLGVDTSTPGIIQAFASNTNSFGRPVGLPRESTTNTALWYRTTNSLSALMPANGILADTNYSYNRPLYYQTYNNKPLNDPSNANNPNVQPILVPVLQIQVPVAANSVGSLNPGNNGQLGDLPTPLAQRGTATRVQTTFGTTVGNWLPTATPTTTNLAVVGGDSPGRQSESNGGLENFVRYLEDWRNVNSNISGSLIQFKRSSYASSPWQVVQPGALGQSIYPDGNNYSQFYLNDVNTITGGGQDGMSPYYTPPNRQWGFDVALLSQSPDLFAQQFTVPPGVQPNVFFREVNQDDPWVQTLMCARTIDAATGTITGNAVLDQRPTSFCTAKTGG